MQSVFGSGTPYTLTETAAKVTMSVRSPTVNVPKNVSRVISARAMIDLSGCTITAPIEVTLKLRKTSGTAADLANSTTTIKVGQIGTSGQNEADIPVILPQLVHNSGSARETIELWASVSALPATGNITIREASILVQ